MNFCILAGGDENARLCDFELAQTSKHKVPLRNGASDVDGQEMQSSPAHAYRMRRHRLFSKDSCFPCQHPCNKKLKESVDDHTMQMKNFTQTSAHALSLLDACDAKVVRQHVRDVRCEKFVLPLLGIINRLMRHRCNRGFFNEPVDVVKLAIPQYNEIIKNPIDLSRIKNKCLQLKYETMEDSASDIRLMFANACRFNPPGHIVNVAAVKMLADFEFEFNRCQKKLDLQRKKMEKHYCAYCLSNACEMCMEKCIHFEFPYMQCLGPCQQRIKRNATYYRAADHQLQYCLKCYTFLPKIVIADNKSIPKSSLEKAKFTDEITEPWVQCDVCSGWFHQICAMFNALENKAASDASDELLYVCPLCRLRNAENKTSTSVDEFPLMLEQGPLEEIHTNGPSMAIRRKFPACSISNLRNKQFSRLRSSAVLSSRDLKTTALSDHMQSYLHTRLLQINESKLANSITIRVVSSIRSTCQISKTVQENFSTENLRYPDKINYISKAICVFQNIRGLEVCIFFMYTQEYGQDCVFVSNRNRVYVAYIDSLIYMRPRRIRTRLYHEILLSYLDYCRLNAFEFAHIWACPTTRGGDFIYYCHPSFQKNPRADRLLQWYAQLAILGREAKVLTGSNDMYTMEFENLEEKMHSQNRLPPIFDGDFWTAEVERLEKSSKCQTLSAQKVENEVSKVSFRNRLIESVKASRNSLFVFVLKSESVMKVREERVYCPFLNTRADMIQNCEQFHYQFDTFRRAKYSTMMLIYQIYKSQKCRNSNGRAEKIQNLHE